jgi:hypothetical protein
MNSENLVVRNMIQAALLDGKVDVGIIMDPRPINPPLMIPDQFRNAPAMTLSLSWNFPDADMVFNDESVDATLSFSGQRFRCSIPYRDVYALKQGGQVAFFKERIHESDIPQIEAKGMRIVSLAAELKARTPAAPEPEEKKDVIRQKMQAIGLRVIQGGGNDVE